jgi:hypothetical protein
MSQGEFARHLGVSLWALDEIERGERAAGRLLPLIADTTSQPVDELSSGKTDHQHRLIRETSESLSVIQVASGTVMGARGLVLGSMVLLVTVRFFTEVVPIVPRAANFIDVPIFFVLTIAGLFARGLPVERQRWHMSFFVRMATFLTLAVASAVVNSFRAEPGPVLVFLYGFLAPLGVYASVYRLWPSGNARAMSRAVVALGLLQFVVVTVVDIPRFVGSHDPDQISGTFGTNAYQLVFFLLLFGALLIGMATIEPTRRIARLAPLLIVATFATILLAQYRSLLASMAVAMIVVTVLLGGRARGLAIAGLAAICFVIVFHYVAAGLPDLKLQSAASSLAGNPGQYASGRLHVAETVSRLYSDTPTAIAIGTGPGTYSSRAWQTFANAASPSRSNVAGSYVSGLTHGKTYATDVSTKYVVPQIKRGLVIQGSRAVSSPFSSYTSLLAEVGVFGFVLIVSAYIGALARAWRMARYALAARITGDPLPAVLLATVVAFLTLLQMGLLENWFEVTRVTFVAWTLLAVSAKELDARGAR